MKNTTFLNSNFIWNANTGRIVPSGVHYPVEPSGSDHADYLHKVLGFSQAVYTVLGIPNEDIISAKIYARARYVESHISYQNFDFLAEIDNSRPPAVTVGIANWGDLYSFMRYMLPLIEAVRANDAH